MRILGTIGFVAAGLMAVQPAHASDKQDFVNCDGRKHPGKSDDGMRGEPSRDGYAMLAAQSRGPAPRERIAACTRALASPRLLARQTLRRAHLLRARAAAYIEGGQPTAALADLDSARTAATGFAGDPLFDRSMGVSLRLLRALAEAEAGHAQAAATLAREAAAERPYSLDVQLVAASIRTYSDAAPGAAADAWAGLIRLEPAAAALALDREAEAGNFAAVRALRPAVQVAWPDTPPSLLQLLVEDKSGTDFVAALSVALNSAYAYAAGGDVARARAELDGLKAAVAHLRTAPAVAEGKSGPSAADLLLGPIDQQIKLTEARIALAEGRYADAVAMVAGSKMPATAATLELAAALRAAAPAGSALVLPQVPDRPLAEQARRTRRLASLADNALLAPETSHALVDYEHAHANVLGAIVGAAFSMGTSLLGGIDRTDGFRSTENPDGTVTVEFVGKTPSKPIVQEMTLLRAAELAHEAGKPGFSIVHRRDFVRRLQTSRGGVPISSTPDGYKTELTIRYADPAAAPARAFDAAAVIGNLGPFYYEEAHPRIAQR